MALSKEYMAKVKDANGVLVGVAQVRVGLPSNRALDYVTGAATVKKAQQVPNSTVGTLNKVDGSGTIPKIIPSAAGIITAPAGTLVSSGTYTGDYDGAFIIRYNGTTFDIYGPDGKEDTAVTTSEVSTVGGYTLQIWNGTALTTSGVKIEGTFTDLVDGMTWIVPVWSAKAISKAQTGIWCPYPIFEKDIQSVGGLKAASFNPKVDETKSLSSGFPETEDAKIITKTSVTVSFEALEYTNTNLQALKDVINSAINESTTSSVPLEIVMRTFGGQLRTFWCPSCTIDSFPTIAPTNDFSSFQWQLTANKPTEMASFTAGSTVVTTPVEYNTYLSNVPVYTETKYLH